MRRVNVGTRNESFIRNVRNNRRCRRSFNFPAERFFEMHLARRATLANPERDSGDFSHRLRAEGRRKGRRATALSDSSASFHVARYSSLITSALDLNETPRRFRVRCFRFNSRPTVRLRIAPLFFHG